jgi:anthranilate/para-aminobenzoate synthase component I
MTPEAFASLRAQGFNRIPVLRELSADLDTPLSIYLKLADAPYSYLFESVQGGEKWGRYSIVGLPCRTVLEVSGDAVTVRTDGKETSRERCADPLTWLEDFRARYRIPDIAELPRFSGGLVGYFAYDTIRYIEPRLAACPNPDALGTPDILLMVSDQVVVYDNLRASPLDLYRALRSLNPSPYMFFLDLGDHQVAGSSPEILVRLEEGEVTVRPIAGTRARGRPRPRTGRWRRSCWPIPRSAPST